MDKSEIKVGRHYAFREKRRPGVPFQQIRILEHIRGKKWKAEWVDPNPGLVDYVDSKQLVVAWKGRKAFLKDEEAKLRVTAHARGNSAYHDTPIANALGWPERIDSGVEPLDLIKVSQLNFAEADDQRFPCLRLARQSIVEGGTSMAILNAANEVAVEAFLQKQIRYTQIAELIEDTMQHIASRKSDSLQQIIEDDELARQYVKQQLSGG